MTASDLDPEPTEPSVCAASGKSLPCSIEELRTLFLFEKLDGDQLQWLCERGHVELIEPGPLYAEGSPATCFYVLLEGNTVMSRRVGGDDIEVGRTSERGVYSGAFTAYLGDRVPQVYNNSVRVTVPSRFFVLDAEVFAEMMHSWFPMAVHLLEGLFFGNKNAQAAIGQRERLLALGSLSAGLTHELNNPAAAAVRATATLRERVAGMRHKLGMIAGGKWDRTTLEILIKLQEEVAEKVPKSRALVLSPLEASDREDAITDWLDDHGITDGWNLSPTFVAAGLDVAWLDHVEATVDEDTLEPSVRWLNYTVETELLMNEIEDSTTRISTLVGAAKQYSQLDRAPYQVVDVHELLDSTLLMLAGKMPPGIHVAKDYDQSVPPIPAYAGELNQVWTNLIDNAVSAMGETGVLTVRTGMDRDKVFIEFGDTGPGVPPEIRNRIFEPFFTTKPVGEGTGLGLDISFRIVVNKHHGELSLESEPGDTRFRVWLPLTPQDDGAALTPDGLDAVTAAARTSAGTAASEAGAAGAAATAEDKENS
jgi:signal transduction histidine kinase